MFKKIINDNNEICSDRKDPLKTVFLVWAPHSIRAKNLAEHLDAKLYLISYKFKKKIYSPIKYIKLFTNTLFILEKEKPHIIISYHNLSVLNWRKMQYSNRYAYRSF
jgi:hypothetical protein